MDELVAHYLTMVGEVCGQARTGRIPVDVVLASGHTVSGVPHPREVVADVDEIDGTGFARHFDVGSETIRLDEIVEVRLRSPAARPTA